jgi:membrane protein implicated in regulation of membrane protease activity
MGMADMTACKCTGCGQTKECLTAEYGRFPGNNSTYRITELNRKWLWDIRVTPALCDDCIGKAPSGIGWIGWLLVASILAAVAGIISWGTPFTLWGGVPLGFAMSALGWFVGVITIAVKSSLMMRFGYKRTGLILMIFAFLFAWTPIPSLVGLIILPKVRRALWVEKQLDKKAGQLVDDIQRENDRRLAEVVAKPEDQLTAEDKLVLQEKRRYDSIAEAATEQMLVKADRGSNGGAVISIVFTICLAVFGLIAYRTGYQMVWFGVRLSTGHFWALMGAFLVYDVFSIIRANRKIERRERTRREKERQKENLNGKGFPMESPAKSRPTGGFSRRGGSRTRRTADAGRHRAAGRFVRATAPECPFGRSRKDPRSRARQPRAS